ncbi:MAG: ABC transporter permease [Actinomycetota bacterium]
MRFRPLVHRNFLVFRRNWLSTLFFSFLNPLLFIAAMGLGLGALLKTRDDAAFGGVSYLLFITPGVLAAGCMQMTAFESSYGTLTKVTYRRNYEAMLATPMSVGGLLTGELIWVSFRMLLIAITFMAVVAMFQLAVSPLALLAIPAAILTGLAYASPIIGFSAKRKNYNDLSNIFRFVITPMFLFSGTFFPVQRLPGFIRPLAYITPLYHGVEFMRGAMLGRLTVQNALQHSTYLIAVFAAGIWYAHRSLTKRLLT